MNVACAPNKSQTIEVGEHNGHEEETIHSVMSVSSEFTKGSNNVLAEGKPILRMGDVGSEYCSCCNSHKESTILQGNNSVLVNMKPIARKGDLVSHHEGESSPLQFGVTSVNA